MPSSSHDTFHALLELAAAQGLPLTKDGLSSLRGTIVTADGLRLTLSIALHRTFFARYYDTLDIEVPFPRPLGLHLRALHDAKRGETTITAADPARLATLTPSLRALLPSPKEGWDFRVDDDGVHGHKEMSDDWDLGAPTRALLDEGRDLALAIARAVLGLG